MSAPRFDTRPRIQRLYGHCRWRAMGHYVYAMVTGEPSKDDVIIGEFIDPVLAQECVSAHNNQFEIVGQGSRVQLVREAPDA